MNDPFTNIDIARFYQGKSVFLTGGTGFIGKVILEKLLRSCPDIKNLYFMIRPKRGKSCQERLEKLLTLPLFKKMHEKFPENKEKIILIQGDITHKALGISDDDRQKIVNNVDIIMHSAATVKFNEPIRVAMEMNVIAVQEMIKLAKEIKNLEVFCHVSTAYSQCNLTTSAEIQERFYPVSVKAEKVIEAMEWMSDKMLDSFTAPLLDKFPNTYTFTKSLAEDLYNRESENIPLVIVRPSIVSSSISDPFPGWVDNYNGVSGIMVAIGRGMVRSLYSPQIKHDIVPVDFVSKCVIVGTWYHGVSRMKTPLICNCTSGNVNPTSFLDMQRIVLPVLNDNPLSCIFRRPNFSFASNRFLHQYWQMVSHYMPAIILDGLTVLVGMKPRFMSLYRTIDTSINTLDFFIQNEWKWGNSQFNKVLKAIPESEKEIFDFDMRKIDWENYYSDMTIGVKRYLIKEDVGELPKARNIHRRYKMVRWLSSTIFILLAGRFFFLKSERFRKLWFEALFCIYRFLQYFKITSVNV